MNYWWTHRTPIERVRWNAGNFYAVDNFMNATDAGQINGFFTTGTPQPAQNWFFWKQGALSSSNPPVSLNTFVVSGAYLVQNYFALCVADFNRSYVPAPGLKSSNGASSIHMLYDEPLTAGPGSEVILPIHVTSSLKAGAISMILDFPSDYVTVEEVLLGNGDMSSWAPVQFSAKGNELRIGWFDQEPGYSLALESYPNPFANIATITYTIPEDGKVTLEVNNVYGSRVAVLVSETMTRGEYSVKFHRGYLNPGVYTVTLKHQVNGNINSRTIKIICSMY